MRNWNIEPKLLCNKHLIGEHGEIHKAVGNLRHTGKWTLNLTKKGFLEPQNFLKRHDKIADEMIKRNFNHKSPLNINNLNLPIGKVDIEKSKKDLIKRCPKCREKINKMKINKYLLVGLCCI